MEAIRQTAVLALAALACAASAQDTILTFHPVGVWIRNTPIAAAYGDNVSALCGRAMIALAAFSRAGGQMIPTESSARYEGNTGESTCEVITPTSCQRTPPIPHNTISNFRR